MIIRLIKSSIIFFLCIFSVTPLIRAQYYGDEPELVSLDIKGMEMDDVLKILSQKTGLNIVADKDVTGTVTLYVKDVDIMDVLDIVVATNNLAYERNGTLVRIMTMEKYKELHGKAFRDITTTEIIKLSYARPSGVHEFINHIKSEEGKIISDERSNTLVLIDIPGNIAKMKEIISKVDIPLSTEVFSLDYAKAEEIKEKLEPMVSEYSGSIKFDERTNKLIVKAPSERIEDIRMTIEAFDEKTQELVIDANIIRLTLSEEYGFGVDWAELERLKKLSLVSAAESAEGLTIAETGSDYAAMASLFKTFGKVDVLSRPRIGVSDREEASILVGSKEAYVTSEVTTTSGGTYHTADHVQFIDVGIKLVVRPEVNKSGYIRLKIRPEVSDIDPAKAVELKNPDGSTRTMAPYVTTSEAETTVLVKDGSTLIISGLMKDISADRRQKEKTELIIFLTPHIVKEIGAKIEKGEITGQEDRTEGEATRKSKPAEKKTRPESGIKKKSRWAVLFGSRPEKEKRQKAEKLGEMPVTAVQKTPYEEYYLAVRNEIDTFAKKQDVEGLKGEVELQFSLDRHGFLTRGPIVLNKPDLKLVRAAVNCVKKISPFPPFPRNMKKGEEEFNIVVRYE